MLGIGHTDTSVGHDHCPLVVTIPALCLLGSLGLGKRTRKYPSKKTSGHMLATET